MSLGSVSLDKLRSFWQIGMVEVIIRATNGKRMTSADVDGCGLK